MTASALLAFLHFVAVFGIVATLFGEWLLLSPSPSCEQARQMQACDRWYGILAAVLLVVGFLRVLYFEKGKAFYFGNPFFHLKLGLFVLVGLLSIYPTIRLLAWRSRTRQGLPPALAAGEYAKLRLVLRAELAGIVGIALCAALMAKGISF